MKSTWDFGDGTEPQETTSTVVSHAYGRNGTYTASASACARTESVAKAMARPNGTFRIAVNS